MKLNFLEKKINVHIYFLIYQIVSFSFPYLKIKLLTNIISKSEYGIFSLIYSSLNIIVFISFLALDRYLLFLSSKNKKEKILSMLPIILVISFFIIIFILYGFHIVNLFKIDFNYLILLPVLITLSIAQLIRFYMYSVNKLDEYYKISSMILSFWIVILVFTLFFLKVNLITLILNLIISYIIIDIIYIYNIKKDLNKITINKGLGKDVLDGLKYSLPLIPFVFGVYSFKLVDRFVILNFLGETNLSDYSVNISLVFFIVSLLGVFYEYLKPIYFHINKKKKNIVLEISVNFLFLTYIPIMFGLLLLKNDIIIFFSNVQYVDSSYLAIYGSLIPILFSLNTISQWINENSNNTKKIGYIYLVSGLTNLFLNFLFVKYFGVKGAIISTTVSLFIVFVFLEKDNKIMNFINLKFICKIFVSSFIMYLILFHFILDFFYWWIVIIFGIVIYGFMMYLVSKKELYKYYNYFTKMN